MSTPHPPSALARPATGVLGALVLLAGLLAAFGPPAQASPTVPTGTAPSQAFQAAPAAASAAARGRTRLKVSPRVYVGGQKLTFSGSVGGRGRQRIGMQVDMGRPGDTWTRIRDFRGRTRPDGSFRFTYPAPGGFNTRFRVYSKHRATPGHRFFARSQESTLTFRPARPVANRDFQVTVDTTPTVGQRPDLPPPAFPGRTVALQKRAQGGTWKTVRTGRTDRRGLVSFTLREPAGRYAYRARQGDETRNGNEIGWHPSFPAEFSVGRAGAAARAGDGSSLTLPDLSAAGPLDPSAYVVDAEPTSGDDALATAARNRGSTNASQRWGWRPQLFDFAWQRGESLSSRPWHGSRRQGTWHDTSTGSGRASHFNAGLMLDSSFRNTGGPGDHGNVAATLRGNAQRYGRWEFRTRSWTLENEARDYQIKMELVPENASDYRCGAQNITVANVSDHSRKLKLGVKALGGTSWSYTKPGVRLGDDAHNVAVEVTKRHISWFLDGANIATVRSPAAVSDVPMTPRVSLVGAKQKEMNHTKVIFDWVRAWTPENGQHPRRGHRLTRTSHRGGC